MKMQVKNEKYFPSEMSSSLYKILGKRTENDGIITAFLEVLAADGVSYAVATGLRFQPNTSHIEWKTITSFKKKEKAKSEFEYQKVRKSGEQKISQHYKRTR